jgi:hypothetical protein
VAGRVCQFFILPDQYPLKTITIEKGRKALMRKPESPWNDPGPSWRELSSPVSLVAFQRRFDPFVDIGAVFGVACVASTVLFFFVQGFAAILPLWFATVPAIGCFFSYYQAVDWARREKIQLESISPRLFRCGPYFSPELSVVRVSTAEKAGPRGGWLVTYRNRGLFSRHDSKVHWDSE